MVIYIFTNKSLVLGKGVEKGSSVPSPVSHEDSPKDRKVLQTPSSGLYPKDYPFFFWCRLRDRPHYTRVTRDPRLRPRPPREVFATFPMSSLRRRIKIDTCLEITVDDFNWTREVSGETLTYTKKREFRNNRRR